MWKWANRTRVTSMMLALLLPCVSAARGDDTLSLKVGARVRAQVIKGSPGKGTTATKGLTGTLLGLSETTITIGGGDESTPLVLDRQSVTKLELSLRRSRRGRGALIGLGAGVAAAFLVGLASGSDENCTLVCFSAAELGGMLSVLLGPAGAAIGAGLAPGERWQTVAPDRIRLGPDAARTAPGRRAAILFTVRF
jgi:hypothetical protein